MKNTIGSEEALIVYFGTYTPSFLPLLASEDDPESLVIIKDLIEKLMGRKQKLFQIILNFPNKGFLESGKISKMKVQNFCRNELKWTNRMFLNEWKALMDVFDLNL